MPLLLEQKCCQGPLACVYSRQTGVEMNEQAAMNLWALRMSLARNNCQQAVETIHDTTNRNMLLDECDLNELVQHLEGICNLLGLDTDFLEVNDD
jgi:hypothetical protein